MKRMPLPQVLRRRARRSAASRPPGSRVVADDDVHADDASAMSTSGPVGSVERPGRRPVVADGDDRVDPVRAQPGRLGLHARDTRIDRGTGRAPRAASARGCPRFEKPTTPSFAAVEGVEHLGRLPLRRRLPGGDDDVRRQVWRSRPAGSSSFRKNCSPAVEVVVAERVGVEAHQVHDLDGRLVLEEVRDRRSRRRTSRRRPA